MTEWLVPFFENKDETVDLFYAITNCQDWIRIKALKEALEVATPEIFNTDQGSQFTSAAFTSCLKNAGVKIRMDGRGRALDNVFVERLWRSLKYERIYIHNYDTVQETIRDIGNYIDFYNHERPPSLWGIEPRERSISMAILKEPYYRNPPSSFLTGCFSIFLTFRITLLILSLYSQ